MEYLIIKSKNYPMYSRAGVTEFDWGNEPDLDKELAATTAKDVIFKYPKEAAEVARKYAGKHGLNPKAKK